MLAARVLIVDATLSGAEIAGAAAALCLLAGDAYPCRRRRAAAIFMLLGAAVVAERLAFPSSSMLLEIRMTVAQPDERFDCGQRHVSSSKSRSCTAVCSTYSPKPAAASVPQCSSLAVRCSRHSSANVPYRAVRLKITDLIMALLIAGGFALLRIRHQAESPETLGATQPMPGIPLGPSGWTPLAISR